MDEKIDTAIEKVLGMIRVNMNPDEAMKVSQAALNLAHAKETLGYTLPPPRSLQKNKTGEP